MRLIYISLNTTHSECKPSSFTHSLQVFLPLPAHLSPATTTTFLLTNTQSSLLLHSYWPTPNHGFSALTFSDFFSLPNSTNLRGHSLRLAVPLARNNIRKHFFAVKIVPIWNSLPDSLVTSSTTSLFKSRLAKHNLSSFLILPSYFVSHWPSLVYIVYKWFL